MKLDIGAIFAQLVERFVRLPLAQKIALPCLLVGIVFLIVFVSRWATTADYGVLFSGLAESDAAGIVEKLKDQKIGFRLVDDGRTIEVTPPALVHELRLEMASSGLPKGGNVGFELFDNNLLGRTGFVEALYGKRALQGELERTIQALDAVRTVRVHIASPERSSFVKRDTPPTASVLLRLKVGGELTPQQVRGIANLVAGSVERLTADNVTILDSKGNQLNEKRDDLAPTELDNSRLDYQRKLEASYARQVESMLASVLGPGKAVARVSADLDFSSFTKEEESFDPGGTVTRSEKAVEELAGLTAEGGVPGVISNLTNEPGALTPPDNTKNNNRRRESVKNFEVSRAVSKTTSAAGKLSRLTVAVLVDGQSGEGGYRPLAPEMLQKIDSLVKNTVGFDAARGDVVTVENMRFAEAEGGIEEALAGAQSSDTVVKLMPSIVSLSLVVALFVILLMLTRFLIRPTEAEVDLSKLLPAGLEELGNELEAERARIRTIPEIQHSSIDMEELEAILGENSRLVRENPQQAALLIRYWLNDGGKPA